MRFYLTALLAAIMVASFPSTASADRADCGKKLENNYSRLYDEVVDRHGTRAPGRNIRKYGYVKRNQMVRNAKCRELRKSRNQLKQLLVVPKPYRSVSTATTEAVNPHQMPSGVQTAQAASTGGSSNSMVNPACESGGNPQVWDPSGTYWGKYQFDKPTWIAHGGAAGSYGSASEVEQDRIAGKVSYDAWPNC
jgi:hypothetical protein